MHRGRPPEDALTVGDLFSGAGGFSEGFVQAGFRVKWAIDNWKPAVATYGQNHPDVKMVSRNVLSLSPADLEKVDVIVGSPPCVHFSLANRGGNGDRSTGLRLVKKFLTIVKHLKPKYWIMENVPNLLPVLKEEMGDSDIVKVFSGEVPVPQREVLDAAGFGVPQHRRRLYSGIFPVPPSTHGQGMMPYVPLSTILDALPEPMVLKPRPDHVVNDPNYASLELPEASLRDHFEDHRWKLTRYERERAKRQKQEHPVYGRMSYPDDATRPSRTITATRTGGARSTIIVRPEKWIFRTLTMREAACAQGFPITYQFWAKSINDKDTLAGNAVPPPIARALAEAILRKEGRIPLKAPLVEDDPLLPEPLAVPFKRGHTFSQYRHFNGVVRVDWRHEHRVELDNQFDRSLGPNKQEKEPELRWKTRLYLGYAKLYRSYEVDITTALNLAHAMVQSPSVDIAPEELRGVLLPTVRWCSNGFPNGQELQDRWTRHSTKGMMPNELCDWIGKAVDKALPPKDWNGKMVPIPETSPILERVKRAFGKSAKGPDQPRAASVRLVTSTIALAIACKGLNEGPEALQPVLHALKSGDERFLDFLAHQSSSTQPFSANSKASSFTAQHTE
jgi:DNA (cytosine-5)-methyltransferase 1